MDEILNKVESPYKKDDIPEFKPGDRVKVHLKIVEGTSERIQIFEGDVIGIRGAGLNENFTVRKVSSGVGVEKIFPLHSSKIVKIEVIRRGKVRRAKLYYLRDRIGKSARIVEKIMPRKKDKAK